MDIESEILRILRAGSPRRRYDDLWVIANQNLDAAIPHTELEAAINSLQNKGLVQRGRGAVETILLANGEVVAPIAPNTGDAEQSNDFNGLPSEAQLMPALGRWLQDRFLPSLGANAEAIIKNTSVGGPKWGVWSKPDYAVASVRRYQYTTLREVDLCGFELKRANAASVVGVHEALAHTRWVHFSYLVWHVPDAQAVGPDLDAIRGECARHGIGLVAFSDPDKSDSWRTELTPEKRATDPMDAERFITERFDDVQKTKLKAWLAMP